MLDAPAPVRDGSGRRVTRMVGRFENGLRGHSWRNSVIH